MSDLSVIIVNWNTATMLRRCLDSLRQEILNSSKQVEVVVVDNSSHDSSLEMLRQEYPEVRVIENHKNLGFARANNQGAGVATAPLLLLLNSDAALCSGALTAMLTYMRQQPTVGVVGLQLLNDDLTLQPSGKRFPTLLSTVISLLPLPIGWRIAYEARRNKRDYGRIVDVDEVSGAAMVVRRDLYLQLGGFDERFYFFGEDLDLCARVRRAGYRVVYLPTARALHSWGSARQSTPTLRQVVLSQRAVQRVLFSHGPRWQAELLRCFLIALTTLRLGRALWQIRRRPSRAAHVAGHHFAQELIRLLRPHAAGEARQAQKPETTVV